MKNTETILQDIINFIEKDYLASSHTYIDTYRASRQTNKKVHNFIIDIAKENNINIKTKELTCKFD